MAVLEQFFHRQLGGNSKFDDSLKTQALLALECKKAP
jgi:hypothetical protein